MQVCMGLGVMMLLLAGLVFCPVWLLLAGKLGKYKTWLIQNSFGAATFLLFFIPRGVTLPILCSRLELQHRSNAKMIWQDPAMADSCGC